MIGDIPTCNALTLYLCVRQYVPEWSSSDSMNITSVTNDQVYIQHNNCTQAYQVQNVIQNSRIISGTRDPTMHFIQHKRVLYLAHKYVLYLVYHNYVLFLVHLNYVLYLVHLNYVLYLVHLNYVLFLVHLNYVLFAYYNSNK